jgi:hypothetical protein
MKRIMLWKRDGDCAVLKTKFDDAARRLALSVKSILADDTVADKNDMLARTFGQCLAHLGEITGTKISLSDISALHRIFDATRNKNLDVSVGEADDDDDANYTERLSNDADAGDDDEDDEDGAHHAGDTGENGSGSVEQLERARRAMKGNNMQTHSELMSSVVKKYGITAFAKSVAEGSVNCSEFALCNLVEETAKREGSTCARLIEEQTERGLAIRKGLQAARDAQFVSRTTSVSKAQSSSMFHAGDENYYGPAGSVGRASLKPRLGKPESVNNPKSALAAVEELVAAQRAANKTLTEAGAWAAVYTSTDPETRRAVEAERLESRPVATGW